MNIFDTKETIHNSLNEDYDLPENLELLNKWTIPKIEPKLIYKLRTFERYSFKQVVKTTESSVALHNEEMVLQLLNQKDILPYKKTHKFIHIGLLQIAFRPLTLEGLPESFISALRDGRNLNWKQSLMGIIQSSHTFISPIDYIVETPQASRASTSQIREEFIPTVDNTKDEENLIINKNNIVHNRNVHQVRETDTVSEMNFSI